MGTLQRRRQGWARLFVFIIGWSCVVRSLRVVYSRDRSASNVWIDIVLITHLPITIYLLCGNSIFQIPIVLMAHR